MRRPLLQLMSITPVAPLSNWSRAVMNVMKLMSETITRLVMLWIIDELPAAHPAEAVDSVHAVVHHVISRLAVGVIALL